MKRDALSSGGATKAAAVAAAEEKAPSQAARPVHAAKPGRSSPSHSQPDRAKSQQPQQHKEKMPSGGPNHDSTVSVQPVGTSSEAQPSPGKSAVPRTDKTTKDLPAIAAAAATDNRPPGVALDASIDAGQAASSDRGDAVLPAGQPAGLEAVPIASDKAPATRPSSSSRPHSAVAPLVPEPSPMESGQLQPESQSATPHTIPKLEPAIPWDPSQSTSPADTQAPPIAHPPMLPSGPSSNGPSAQSESAIMPGQMQSFPPGFPPSPSPALPLSRPTRVEAGWIRPAMPAPVQDGWIRPPFISQRLASRSPQPSAPLPPQSGSGGPDASAAPLPMTITASAASAMNLPPGEGNNMPLAGLQLHTAVLAAAASQPLAGAAISKSLAWTSRSLGDPSSREFLPNGKTQAALPMPIAASDNAALAPPAQASASLEQSALQDQRQLPPQPQQLGLSIAGMTKPNLHDLRRQAMQNLQDSTPGSAGPLQQLTQQRGQHEPEGANPAAAGPPVGAVIANDVGVGSTVGVKAVSNQEASQTTRASGEGSLQSGQGLENAALVSEAQPKRQPAEGAGTPRQKLRHGAAAPASAAAEVAASPALLVTEVDSPTDKGVPGRHAHFQSDQIVCLGASAFQSACNFVVNSVDLCMCRYVQLVS